MKYDQHPMAILRACESAARVTAVTAATTGKTSAQMYSLYVFVYYITFLISSKLFRMNNAK